ncbi:MAG TPA: hypothetical protein VD908_16505 [Cytophagales bacterium]|nr:hypothetical protein [Cytophagales bacterium]
MSFKYYLLEQINRTDRVGELAKRIKRSTPRYIKANSYEEIYSFLYNNYAGEEELHALRTAFTEYSGELVE